MPRTRSNRPHPQTPLATALQVAEAISENNASRPMNRLLLAQAMGYSPNSSGFREKIAASAKYGFTEGNFHSDIISLTARGLAATRPRNEDERIKARRDAFRSVQLFDDLMNHFTNSKLPEPDFLKNTLERDPHKIDPEWSKTAAEAFIDDAREVGFLREIGGSPFIVVDASNTVPETPPTTAPNVVETDTIGETDDVTSPGQNFSVPDPVGEQEQQKGSDPASRPVPMQLFIAHGSNRTPFEQLKGILNGWKVPFLAAIDEPNAGRPISEKVADTMRQCSAGIFIFTADEQGRNDTGDTIYRPSQNVVYELGAASLLYGRKIVILKEVGVTFPSDFSDLGWIEFETDALDAKGMDLLKEMIALEALKLVSAASA